MAQHQWPASSLSQTAQQQILAMLSASSSPVVGLIPSLSHSQSTPSTNNEQFISSSNHLQSSTLTGTSSKLSSAASVHAETFTFGQTLTKLLTQHKSRSQSASSLLLDKSELFPPPTSSSMLRDLLPASVSEASENRQSISTMNIQVSNDSKTRSSSPENSACVSKQPGVCSTDRVSQSPVTLPDNFLSPSPKCYSVNSPGSVFSAESPGTTDSDHFADKSISSSKEVPSEEVQTPSSKRRRVRKSRAKPQDPVQHKVAKRTRRVRANDRERSRMHGLNDAMDELRKHIPNDGSAGKMTKIDTLRTAANYIRVLKLMLGEVEKGGELANWSNVNNLCVQPLASPDSTGMVSPRLNALCDEGRLQNCGGIEPPAAAAAGVAGYSNPGCGLGGIYGTAVGVSGMVTSVTAQNSGRLVPPDSSFGSQPLSSNVNMGYGDHRDDLSASVLDGFYSPSFSINGHCSSSQNVTYQQSSQCY